MAVASPIGFGGQRKCSRSNDIVVPIFRTAYPYTFASSNSFVNQSLWPITQISSTNFEVYGPTQKGNVVFPNGNLTSLFCSLWGDFLFLGGGPSAGSTMLYQKILALTGKTSTISTPTYRIGYSTCDPGVFNTTGQAPCTSAGLLSGNQTIVLASARLVPAFGFIPVFATYELFGAAGYVYSFIPIPISYKAFAGGPDYDFLYAYQGTSGSFTNSIVAAIPNFLTGRNSILVFGLLGNTGTHLNIGSLTLEGSALINSDAQASEILFDDPIIQANFNTGAQIQATAFGYLMVRSLVTFPGQPLTYILVSPDGTTYSLIRLIPENGVVWNDITGGGASLVTIDPNGVFYLKSSGVTFMDNSFSINIPWPATPFNTFKLSPFQIPGICGCTPLGTQE